MKLNILLFSYFAFLLASCTSPENFDQQSNIPELIQRSEKIQLGKEWDYVQNFYSDQVQSIKKNQNINESRLNLAELMIKEARVTGEHGHYYPAALQLLNEVLIAETLEKDLLFRSLVNKAGVELSLHEFNTALETAKKALMINSENAQINGVLVDCYVELGKYDLAVKHADKMISLKPDIRSYSRISYLREIHGDIPGAIKALELAIKSGYPGYEETAWAMQTLGDLYIQEGQLDKAQKVYLELLEIRSDYPFAIAALGEIEYQKDKLSQAEKHITEAIDIIPEVGFYIQLAHIYQDQNKTEELAAVWKEIIEMLLDDEKAGHNMNLEYASIYKNLMSDNASALSYVQKEYKKRPDNIDVNRLLAEIYTNLDKQEKAKIHLDKALITNSKHPDLAKIKTALETTE